MSEPTPTTGTFTPDTAELILETLATLGIGVASALIPGAPVIALLAAFLPQIEQLAKAAVDFVAGVEVSDEDLATARLMVRQQRARAQFEQWRISAAMKRE